MKIALVSYYFPPTGGAGVQRPTQLVRHLANRGHQLVVVTAPEPAPGRWTPADPSLLDHVPPTVDVRRLDGPEPEAAAHWHARRDRWLDRRTAWASWWIEGVVDMVRRHAADADVIYSVLSPYETAEACAQLARELRVPWVPGLGDPWALDDMAVYPSLLHRRRDLDRMEQCLAEASAIVMSTPDAALRVRSLPALADQQIVAVPNGYDARDFEADLPPRENDGVLRVVHTGYLHTELGRRQRRTAIARRLLGGAPPGVEIMTRSHVYLLEAVNRLRKREPRLGERVEVHLAGVTSSVDREAAANCPAVKLHGYLSHPDSVALLRSGDLLFLPMQRLANGRRAGNVPGKTYEYLASGRTILGAVPQGDARDLLRRAGGSFVCEPDDVDAMTEILAECAEARLNNDPLPQRDLGFVREFEWARRADRVEALLLSVVGRRHTELRAAAC